MNDINPEQAEIAAPSPPETQPNIQETPSSGLPPLNDTPVEKIDQLMADLRNSPNTQDAILPATEEASRTRVLPNRIPTAQFSEVEQEAIALGKQYRDNGEEAPSLSDRIEIVKSRREERLIEEQEASRQDAASQPEQIASEVDAELEATILEHKELIDTLGIQEYHEKTQKIAELTRKKQEAQAAVSQKTTLADEAFKSARSSSIEKAMGLFPSSRDSSSELGQEIQSLISSIRSSEDHPDRSVLSATNAPVMIAQLAAQSLAERLAGASGRSIAAELSQLMEQGATPSPSRQQEPRSQQRITTAGGAASNQAPAPNAPKSLDLGSKESFNLAAIEAALPTRKPLGYVLRH